MMQITKREFPNPVLAFDRDDYAEGCSYAFNIDADNIIVSKEFIEIPVRYELNCLSFEHLLKDGTIQSVVKVKSSAASFCRIFSFEQDKRELTIQIPKYSVIERLELTGMIVANKELLRYSCPEMNELYFTGMIFNYRRGDPLAVSTPRTIYIDDSELEKPIVSIFSINRGHEQADDIVVDFSEDKININLSERLNDMYWSLKDYNNGALRRYVTSIIVTPALVEAVDVIKMHYAGESEEDYSEKRWFRAIELKVGKLGMNMENCVESSVMIADKLLGNISLDALKSFKDMLEQEMNNGETQVIGGVD